MATLSEADKLLTEEQQKQILAYKEQWEAANAAGNQADMDAAHAGAEAIRNSAGYTGGADGNTHALLSDTTTTTPQTTAQTATPTTSGLTADQVQKWVDDYYYTNYDANSGWKNGYSVDMNQRSISNYIRQQMQANSDAWHAADAATQAYLHEQNQQLAKILADSVGGAESTYNEQLGRWETTNANLGYGYNVGQYNDPDWYKNMYGMTDEQAEQYRSNTDRYRNYVDQRVVQNWFDPSSGYTGIYSQFVNGPYGQLLAGTNNVRSDVYRDDIGDGFNEMGYEDMLQIYQEFGPQAPALKNNNNISDYTKQFTSYVDENGIIQPGQLVLTHRGGGISGAVGDGSYSGVTTPISASHLDTEKYAQTLKDARNHYLNHSHLLPDDADLSKPWETEERLSAGGGASGAGTGGLGGLGGLGGAGGLGGTSGSLSGTVNFPSMSEAGSLEEYLKMMYAANIQSQTLALQQAYEKNLADLATAEEKAAAAYDAQKRQTDGKAAQQAANWREVANAMGLNSGAFGQAALAQNNQLQSDLTTLSAAQAQSQAETERQRALLGQEYQNAILKAQADNNMDLAYALYQEAVRQDEALRQEQQFQASLAADMAGKLLSMASSSSGGSRSYSGGGGGSGGLGGGVETGGVTGAIGSDDWYQSLMQIAYSNGQTPQDYINQNYKALGIPYSQLSKYTNGFSNWVDDNAGSNPGLTTNAYALMDMIHDPTRTYTDKVAAIEDYRKNLKISDFEMNRLMDELAGYTPG